MQMNLQAPANEVARRLSSRIPAQGGRRERAHRAPLPKPLPEQVPELCAHEAPSIRVRVDSSCSEPHARRAVRARAERARGLCVHRTGALLRFA